MGGVIIEDYTYINDKPLNLFGGLLLADYEVGQAKLSFTKSENDLGNGFIVTDKKVGLRNISLKIHIYADTPENAQESLSVLTREFVNGKVRLGLPDGFVYFAVITGQQGPKLITEEILEVTFTFEGIRCRPMVEAEGNEFFILGTLPEMECVITVTVGATALSYDVAGITFDGGDEASQMVKGDVIIIDGINKVVTINGKPSMNRCNMIKFPTVKPGNCTIDAPDPIKLKYYPAFL